MIKFRHRAGIAAGLAALTALGSWANAAHPHNGAAADEAAVRAVNLAWYKAYNAGDGAAVAALYADDAVTGPPNEPAVRGKAALLAYFTKDAAAFAATGSVDSDGSTSEVEISGDLAWAWGTYRITDRSGSVVFAGGKYLTLFWRRGGSWKILREIYNSDASVDAATWMAR